eukprot:CFRG3684T1
MTMNLLSNPSAYEPLMVVPHRYTAWLGAIPPLVGLTLVFVLSIYKDFDSVNKTHCEVPNIIPSISSCIGNSTPQRYVWRLCISLMLIPRIYSGFLYYNWFQVEHQASSTFYNVLNKIVLCLFMAQYTSLAMLTYVGSNENHNVHEISTITFMIFSTVHQWLHIILYKLAIPDDMDDRQKQSYYWKIKSCLLFDFGAISMVILYIKHNTVCSAYMYSFFATCEWFCVIMNVLFHYSESIDLGDMSWAFGNYSPATKKAI